MSEKRFRIMGGPSLPWGMVEPYRDQAKENHDQTLERLNERGGLSPGEFWCVVHGLKWREAPKDDVALPWLRAELAKYEATRSQTELAQVKAQLASAENIIAGMSRTIREFQEASMLGDHQDHAGAVTPTHLRQAVQDWGDEIQRLTAECTMLSHQLAQREEEFQDLLAKHERVLDRQEELAAQLHQYKTVAIDKGQLPVVVMSLADFTAMHKEKK